MAHKEIRVFTEDLATGERTYHEEEYKASVKALACSACSGSLKAHKTEPQLLECRKCGGLHSDTMYLGDSYGLVLPYFETGEYTEEELRYFDFTCVGSEGIERRHGWFVPRTKRIAQVG